MAPTFPSFDRGDGRISIDSRPESHTRTAQESRTDGRMPAARALGHNDDPFTEDVAGALRWCLE
jgi:hypothetical protein